MTKQIFTPQLVEFPLAHITEVTKGRLYIQKQLIGLPHSPEHLKEMIIEFITKHAPEVRTCRDPRFCRLVHYRGTYSNKYPVDKFAFLRSQSVVEQKQLLSSIVAGAFNSYFRTLFNNGAVEFDV